MTDGESGSKIARVMEKYDLDGMAADLEAKWTREDPDERYSLRELETHFNTAIVRSVFNRLGAVPAEYSAEEVYEILSADDANVADETFLRTWLDERGVDPDELAADFLSYQSIYNYLREERSVESPATTEYTPEERKQQGIERVDRLKRRAEKVCEKWISVLQRVDVLPEKELTVRIVFQVECPDCGTRSSITTYMYQGDCPVCSTDENAAPEHRSDPP